MSEAEDLAETRSVTGFANAKSEDAAALRVLAHSAEAHWGYDRTFMEIFDRVFNIAETFILENPVFVFWNGKEPEAFWGLRRDGDSWELEYFYVAERSLGKGAGRRMWDHLTYWCREQGIKEFHFVTSPQAVGFYEKMGARLDGLSRSTIDGRPIPHFEYAVI